MCADRTEVACDVCSTPLSQPIGYSDGFDARCNPCDVRIRLDVTAREQRRSARATPARPMVEPEKAPPPPRPVPAKEEKPSEAEVRSHALEFFAEAASGADYRGADRAITIVCQPRVERRKAGYSILFVPPLVGVMAGAIMFASLPSVPSFTGDPTVSALVVGAVTTGLAFLWKLVTSLDEEAPGVTRLRAGPDGLDVEKEGRPSGWHVEAPRVQRIFAIGDAEGIMRVRVELDDGTKKELLVGLTEDEATEVIAQVDRALPGRQAGA